MNRELRFVAVMMTTVALNSCVISLDEQVLSVYATQKFFH